MMIRTILIPTGGQVGRAARRGLAAALALMLSLSASLPALAADTWPVRPIKVVVGFGPGGANDLVARAVAEGMAQVLKATIIVENRPGAGMTVGADYVAKSAPDGHTVFVGAGGIITNPLIRSSMPYREGDLVPVAMMAVSPSVIVVPVDSPVKDLRDLMAMSRQPRGINFSTAGTGSTPHFVAEMLKLRSEGGKFEIVPYKSGADGMVAVLSHQVDMTSEASVVVIPPIQGGKLRAVASTWDQRISALPQVPTAREQGYPEIFIGHWAGLFAPRGTPEPVLEQLNLAVQGALRSAPVRARLVPVGIEPMPGNRATFSKFLAEERQRLEPIVRNANMRED
jgi:tripartite-type tricarboxylate transporter receptor subunit TctC